MRTARALVVLPAFVVLCSISLFCGTALAQLAPVAAPGAGAPQAPAVDPVAVGIAQRAVSALGGAASVRDVTLTGTVHRTAGSTDESGPIILKALGSKLSRVEMNLPSGKFVELRGQDSGGLPKSSWTGTDGTTHAIAGHNTLTDAVWFFPALSSLSASPAADPALSLSSAQDTKNGAAVQKVHFTTQLPTVTAPATTGLPPGAAESPLFPLNSSPQMSHLAATDVYLDPSTSLPIAAAFNTHPDNNDRVDIPVEVRFSDYRAVNGVQVPFRIQKFFNGTLLLDITLQSAAINSGLSVAEFSAQ